MGRNLPSQQQITDWPEGEAKLFVALPLPSGVRKLVVSGKVPQPKKVEGRERDMGKIALTPLSLSVWHRAAK